MREGGGAMRILLALLAALPGALAQEAQEAPLVFEVAEIDKIRAAEGKRATVRGLIESTGKSRGTGMNFLNFPNREFSAVVFGRSLKNFPEGEPADTLKGQWVAVSGVVSIYKGEPQIVVESPEQITLLDPETMKPDAPEEPEPPEPPEEEPGPAAEEAVQPEGEAVGVEPGKVDPRDYFDDP